MKYYSEVLKKVFDSIAELEKAEKSHKEGLVKEAEGKKALATRIEQAGKEVDKAYEDYEKAKEKAAKVLEESNKNIETILNEAKDVIKKAEENKRDAIQKFNQRYGPYTTTYTGEKALNEFNKVVDSLSKDFLRFWF